MAWGLSSLFTLFEWDFYHYHPWDTDPMPTLCNCLFYFSWRRWALLQAKLYDSTLLLACFAGHQILSVSCPCSATQSRWIREEDWLHLATSLLYRGRRQPSDIGISWRLAMPQLKGGKSPLMCLLSISDFRRNFSVQYVRDRARDVGWLSRNVSIFRVGVQDGTYTG